MPARQCTRTPHFLERASSATHGRGSGWCFRQGAPVGRHRAGHSKGLVPPDSPEGLGEVPGGWDGNWGSRPRACLWRGSATAPAATPAPQSLLCWMDGLTHRALRGRSQARAPRALCLLPVFPPPELCATRDVPRSHLRPLRSSAAWLPRFSYKRDRQTHAVTRPLKGSSSHAALTPASPPPGAAPGAPREPPWAVGVMEALPQWTRGQRSALDWAQPVPGA